jgi:hypothetical protein
MGGMTRCLLAAACSLLAATADEALQEHVAKLTTRQRHRPQCGREFEKLKGKRLGPRDLGVPAARACMQKGDGAAAIAWLESIPPRFRPRSLENDPIFTPVRERPEFKALFQSR